MAIRGEGVAKDYAEAVKWYRKAADQDCVAAQYHLGVAYDHGWGVANDDVEAVKWYRKAAQQKKSHSSRLSLTNSHNLAHSQWRETVRSPMSPHPTACRICVTSLMGDSRIPHPKILAKEELKAVTH